MSESDRALSFVCKHDQNKNKNETSNKRKKTWKYSGLRTTTVYREIFLLDWRQIHQFFSSFVHIRFFNSFFSVFFLVDTQELRERARHRFSIYIWFLVFICGSDGGSCCSVYDSKQQYCHRCRHRRRRSINKIKLIFPNGLHVFHVFFLISLELTHSLFVCCVCLHKLSIFMHDSKKSMLLNCWPQYFQPYAHLERGFCAIIFIYLFAEQSGKVGKKRRTFELLAYDDECVCVHKIGFTLQNVNNEIWSDHIWFASERKNARRSIVHETVLWHLIAKHRDESGHNTVACSLLSPIPFTLD